MYLYIYISIINFLSQVVTHLRFQNLKSSLCEDILHDFTMDISSTGGSNLV